MSSFLESVIKRLKYYKELGDRTFGQLEENDLHFQPDMESNSPAIIIQHMSGKVISRWTNFLTEDGEKPWRRRDDEFEDQQYNKLQLMEHWEKGWACTFDGLKQLNESDLAKTVYIRSEALSVTDAIIRQVAHIAYHVGQIVYIGKMIKSANWKNLSMEKRRSADSKQ